MNRPDEHSSDRRRKTLAFLRSEEVRTWHGAHDPPGERERRLERIAQLAASAPRRTPSWPTWGGLAAVAALALAIATLWRPPAERPPALVAEAAHSSSALFTGRSVRGESGDLFVGLRLSADAHVTLIARDARGELTLLGLEPDSDATSALRERTERADFHRFGPYPSAEIARLWVVASRAALDGAELLAFCRADAQRFAVAIGERDPAALAAELAQHFGCSAQSVVVQE